MHIHKLKEKYPKSYKKYIQYTTEKYLPTPHHVLEDQNILGFFKQYNIAVIWESDSKLTLGHFIKEEITEKCFKQLEEKL